ncbi:putative beta-lysine N-acetyltransferase [Clostridium sp. MB40-C1]|uniref:putative beta-lysine N-acetyltransferase n=1 Tax=Clostridium sp. MB40-C1 TaxID=3070996 RepID=UPI0027DEF050|nr:putative beta-lysine N-acetyltransferase [Clostridium sp. MB40-C1]WMJ79325.1 putative beta-lysine N-acetyltransferase [Clostridium sp. MB40-C1]
MDNTISKIGKSLIQHDKENDRIYLMKLHKDDISYITNTLDELSKEKGYTKIFAKIPCSAKSIFLEKHYCIEAVVPNLYKGKEDGIFMAKYFSEDRHEKKDKEIINKVLDKSKENKNTKKDYHLPEQLSYRKACAEDAKIIAEFYKDIFKTYPFPIHDHKYILKTMNENVVYFSIWNGDKLVAISSSEMDKEKLNVEMTDFGTNPKYSGKGLAVYLLNKMEDEMRNRGIKTAYSIARSISYGMNITFSKNSYTFAGTLINNTNISGGIESMNVWYKEL